MMTIELTANQRRRHRGMILQFVSENHYARRSRLDDLQVWSLLSQITGDTIGQDYVCTLLEELQDFGYLALLKVANRLTGQVRLTQIQLTAQGRAIVERYKEDPMVLIP